MIKTKIGTKKLRGNVKRRVVVTSNDPTQPQYVLNIGVNVLSSVQVLPHEQLVITNRQSLPAPRILVRRDPTEKGTLNVHDLSVSAPWIEAKATKLTADTAATDGLPPGRPGDYLVELVPKEPMPYGQAAEKLKFKTGLGREPEVEVNVRVAVVPPVRFSEKELFLPPNAEGVASDTFTFMLRPGVNAEKISVESDPPEISVKLEKAGRLRYRADVSWEMKKTDKSGKITFIHEDEKVELPVVTE